MGTVEEYRRRAHAAEALVRTLTMEVGALIYATERSHPIAAAEFHADVCHISKRMVDAINEG